MKNKMTFLSEEKFVKVIGIGIVKFNNRYPEYRKKLEQINREFNKFDERLHNLEKLFSREWNKVLSDNKTITMIEFADNCGVDRNVFYKEFPHWVEIINSRKTEVKSLNNRKVIEKWNQIKVTGKSISVNDFRKICGISRRGMDEDFPDLKAEIMKWRNENA